MRARQLIPFRMTWMSGILALLMTLAPLAGAQTKPGPAPVDFSMLRKTERDIDSRIELFDKESPLEVIGATRGVYLAGTGLVYSLEVSLAPAAGISPFFSKMAPADVEKIHRAKLSRVPVLQELMLSLMPELAVALRGLQDGEDLVMAATLFYFPYENLEGLPRQLIVRANAGALRKLHFSRKSTKAAEVSAVSRVISY